jgi:glycogen debranching enzyme
MWLPTARRLADGWTDGRPDEIRRPNALIAAARPEVPLTVGQRRDVVRAADADLLTPWGLRSLAPDDVAYHPRYEGGPVSRDRAYHQGTVWPWWLGAYVEASLLAFGRGRAVVARLRALLDGLAPVTAAYGLGHLPEVFDGDPPHRPGGTFAQAFSDAEVLRAYALLDGPAGPHPGRRLSRRHR